MLWGPQENALLKNLLTHCTLLIPNIWLERKPFSQSTRCLVYPLPNIWAVDGIISFSLGSLATVTPRCNHSMGTQHEDDGCLDLQDPQGGTFLRSVWVNSTSLWFKICWLLVVLRHFDASTFFNPYFIKSREPELKKNTLLTFKNRRPLAESYTGFLSNCH